MSKRHAKTCPWRKGGSVFCQCGALGTPAEQQRARNLKDARHPTKRWRVQGDKEANVADLGPFDEIVVGHWLHVEMLNKRSVWMRIGRKCIWLYLRADGRVEVTAEEDRP